MGTKTGSRTRRILALTLVFLLLFGQIDVPMLIGGMALAQDAEEQSGAASSQEGVVTQPAQQEGSEKEAGKRSAEPEEPDSPAASEPTAGLKETAAPQASAVPSPEPTEVQETSSAPSPEPTATLEVPLEPSPVPSLEPTTAPEASSAPSPEPTTAPEASSVPSPEPTEVPENPEASQPPAGAQDAEAQDEEAPAPSEEPDELLQAQFALMAPDDLVQPFSDTMPKTALEAAQAAAAGNQDSSFPTVAIGGVSLSQAVVRTGETFVYSIEYALRAAPEYVPEGGIQPLPAYNNYENVKIQIQVPENIVLSHPNGKLIDGGIYEISLGTVSLSSQEDLNITARMADNGLSADGTIYEKLEVSMTADVTADGQKVTFEYDLTDDTYNKSAVKNKADGQWGAEKSVVSHTPQFSTDTDGNEIATFTYLIKIGKLVDGNISDNAADYDVYGALNFIEDKFSLTDMLPTFTNDGLVSPVASSISLLDSAKEPISSTTQTGGVGVTQLAITQHNTTSLQKGYADGSGIQTPFYSEYYVTASYLLDDLTVPFGDEVRENDESLFDLTNSAEFEYQLIGKSLDTAEPSAPLVWKKIIQPRNLSINKRITIDSNDAPYNADVKAQFPPKSGDAIKFFIYSEENWDVEAGAPVGGAQPDYTYDLSTNVEAQPILVKPGKYYVLEDEATMPTGTIRGPAVLVDVPETGADNATATYINAATYGLVHFKKVGVGGAALSGVQFVLTGADDQKYYGTSNSDGAVYILAPAGTYTLDEVSPPEGYLPMETKADIVVEGGKTLELGEIENISSEATLDITKYAVSYGKTVGGEEGEPVYAPGERLPIGDVANPADFTFTLSWEEKEGGTSTPHSLPITLDQYGRASVKLDIIDADGNVIVYTLVEDALTGDAAQRFVMDAANHIWPFDPADGTKSVAFNNVLKRKITIKKEQMDFGADAPEYPAGIEFDLYREESDGSYTLLGALTTGEGGIAVSDYLDIAADETGDAIQYYLVEKTPEGYTVAYPESELITPTPESEPVSAWPIELSLDEDADYTSTPVVNKENKGAIKLRKTDSGGALGLEGAKFKVYTLDEQGAKVYLEDEAEYETDEDGLIVLSPLDIGKTYYFEETQAPDTYLKRVGDDLSVALTTPLAEEQINILNDRKPLLSFNKELINLASGADEDASEIGFEVYVKGADGFEPLVPPVKFTTEQDGTYSLYLPGSGTYYLKETYPQNVLLPGVVEGLYERVEKDEETGEYFIGPIDAAINDETDFTARNYLNSGRLEITKKDAKNSSPLSGAEFEVRVTLPEGDAYTIAQLTALGFVESEGAYALRLSTANGLAALDGLPIYDGGALLSYTVEEITPPEGYFLSEENEQTEAFDLSGQSLSPLQMAFKNTPKATYTARKMWNSSYGAGVHSVNRPLEGAELAIYKKTLLENGNIQLDYVTSQTTGENGKAAFSELDGLGTYVVFEQSAPDGYDLPGEKIAAGILTGEYGAAAYAKLLADYNALPEHDFSKTPDQNEYEEEDHLLNYDRYAQFRLTKVDEATKEPLNHAKFKLYSSEATVEAQVFEDLWASGSLREEDYTYETGMISDGVFITNPQEYGRVYWLVEAEAPHGYEKLGDGVYGPYTPEGLSWGTHYEKNALYDIKAENKQSGSGEGDDRRFMQIKLNKWLIDEDGEFIKNLPGARFKLWLADGEGNPVIPVPISSLTTGLGMSNVTGEDCKEVAGQAVSESFDMKALYDNPQYAPYITLIGEESPYDYKAKFVLEEIQYPADSTPTKHYWVFDAETQDQTYTVNDTYTGDNSITNLWAQKVPLRVRKLGYNLADPDVKKLLEGVEIGLYDHSQAAGAPIETAITDQYGLASFLLDPYKTYYIREYRSIAGYELNPTVFKVVVGGYGSTLEGITIEDPEYRKLEVTKLDADGEPLKGATFKILKSNGAEITDSNGELLAPNTITTDDSGKASIMLPAGIYRIDEISVGGTGLSATEQGYFKLINAGTNSINLMVQNKAEFKFEFVNHARGALSIVKIDDARATMADVSFAVAFKAFATAAELESTFESTVNENFAETGDVWTTDSKGEINKTGLIPGWYRLTETVPEGYVGHGQAAQPLFVKVTAKGIGQTDNAAVPLQVDNVRKGYLEISKLFEDSSLYDIPSSVKFAVHRKSGDGVGEKVADVTVNILADVGGAEGPVWEGTSQPTALDPGIYYIREESGNWYGRYQVDGGEESWLDDFIEITVEPSNTAQTPVQVHVSNRPDTAKIVIDKIDDSQNPVAGAVFAVFYRADGQEIFLKDAAGEIIKGVTDDEGKTTLVVTLPKARVLADETQYHLRELSAPERYVLAEDFDLELTPGAVADGTGEGIQIENKTGIIIDLTKYGRTKANIGDDPHKALLPGARFELYKVNTQTWAGEFIASHATDANGELTFGNLAKLEAGEGYYLRETVWPAGYTAGLLELYEGETKLSAQSASAQVGGQTLNLYPVSQSEPQDQDVSLQAYNTPKSPIVILKYNYTDSKSPTAVPKNAHFTVTDAQSGEKKGDLYVGEYQAYMPDALADEGTTYGVDQNLYVDGDGNYYSAAILSLLDPGDYIVKEVSPASGFISPSEADESDPWYPEATVTVGDNGEPVVVKFANVADKALIPKIEKSVYAINSEPQDGAAEPVQTSLQDAPLEVTFELKNFASPSENPFLLPLRQLTVTDDQLAFFGKANKAGDAAHFVQEVRVGRAHYLETPVGPVPTGEAARVRAEVYGTIDAAETLLATLDITDSGDTVSFPENTYDGFKVVYTAWAGGALLQPGFAADPIYADMVFSQEDDPAVVPVYKIQNTAKASLTYMVSGKPHSAQSQDDIDLDIDPEEQAPPASLTKSVIMLDAERNPIENQPEIPVSEANGWLRYQLTFTNLSETLAIKNPAISDLLPGYLAVSLEHVSLEPLASLTNSQIGRHTDEAGNQYIYCSAEGTLEPGASMTLIIDGMVSSSVVATDLQNLTNTAYATSLNRVNRNEDNPFGTSFRNESGNIPGDALPGEAFGGGMGQTYQALKTTADVALTQASGLKLYKIVAADASGLGNFVADDKYATANVKTGGDKGKIIYQLVIVNGATTPAPSVRLLDKLPSIGDTGFNGGPGLSKWDARLPAGGGIISVRDEKGNAIPYKQYFTSGLTNSAYINAVRNGPGGWSTSTSGDAEAFLLEFGEDNDYTIAPGGKIIVMFEAWAPSGEPDPAVLNDYYFELAINRAMISRNGGSPVDSPTAKVILLPEPVSLGNRVWLDTNMNGLQDGGEIDDPTSVSGEPSYTDGGITFTLVQYTEYGSGETDTAVVGSANPDANGFYQFDGLTPAVLKTGIQEGDAYDALGNIKGASLKGSHRVYYQLKVSGIPEDEGYIVTMPYAGSAVAPHHESGDTRLTDSNFKKGADGVYYSEKFYLRPAQEGGSSGDWSFDLGLCKIRELEITKHTDDGEPLSGVEFTIYGPFDEDALTGGLEVSDANRVTSITTNGLGKASFAGDEANGVYLNYYANYVVVETQGVFPYDRTTLSATGSGIIDAVVTGDVIDGSNYFVLGAKGEGEARTDAVTAVNPYTATGELVISGEKTLSGRSLNDDDFTFELRKLSDQSGGIMQEVQNEGGAFTFDSIRYTQDDIGSHTYEIRERIEDKANHTYDQRVYTLVVDVAHSDLKDGKLTLGQTLTYSDEGVEDAAAQSIVFANAYAATVDVTLAGEKALSGRALAAEDFAFTLEDKTDPESVDASNLQLSQTVYNQADGTFAFEPLSYNEKAIGQTFTYRITEVDEGKANHTYAQTEYTVEVSVDYDADTCELTAEVRTYKDGSQAPEEDNKLTFANAYAATVDVTLGGEKALSGRALAAEDFAFTLEDKTDPESVDASNLQLSQKVYNQADGTFAFEPLHYNEKAIGQTFTYKITEVDDGKANHTYAQTEYTVEVDIGYDADTCELTAEVRTYKDGSQAPEEDNKLTFANAYAATVDVTLAGEKALSGRALAAEDFAFTLEDKTDPESADASNLQLSQTVYNRADGTFAFEPLSYNEKAIGQTFTYKITEVDEGKANHTYAQTEYTVEVDVGYDADTCELTAEVRTYKDGSQAPEEDNKLTFVNAYAATVDVTLEGEKALSGRALAAEDFAFTLEDKTDPESADASNLQLSQTVYNQADGKFAFEPLHYNEKAIGQTFTYKITEVDEGKANHTYAQTEYTVEVDIGYDADTCELTAEVRTYKDGSQAPEEDNKLTFANAYAATVDVTLAGEKALSGRALAAGDFAFTLEDKTDPESADASNLQLSQTVYNQADGTFAFEPLRYNEKAIGQTFTYKIVEVDEGKANHTYAQTEYTVEVDIGYDADTCELTAEVRTYKDGSQAPEEDNKLAFANAYAATVDVTLAGEKALSGRALAAEDFAFTLEDKTDPESADASNLQLSQMVYNQADGKFAFEPLHYNEKAIGQTFTYKITEVDGGRAGYTYAQTEYTVEVSVDYDAETYGLTAAVRTYKDGSQVPETDDKLIFNNSYKATGSFVPEGTKRLEGRPLAQGMFRFVVKDEDGDVVSMGVSDALGNIAFSPIGYEKSGERDDTGTHAYTVSEIAGNEVDIDDAGILYSQQAFSLNVTVTDAQDGALDIEATYPDGQPDFENGTETISVAGLKVWSDESDLYGHRPASVVVLLMADGVRIRNAVVTGNGDAWAYSFTGLPKYRYEGQTPIEIAYSVDEEPVAGYAKAIDGYRIVNTLRQLTVSKQTSAGRRLAGATLTLYKVEEGGANTRIESWRTQANIDHIITGLNPGRYLLTEDVVPDGYIKAADIEILIGEDGAVSSDALTAEGVVRMVDEPVPTTNLVGTKTWIDLANEGGLRPDRISLTLYADGAVVNASPTWTKNGDIWTYTYTGLRIYRRGNSGARIVYTVEEAPVEGYEALYDGLNITNQLSQIEVEYISVSGRKRWSDNDDAAGIRPESITVYLIRNGEIIEQKTVTQEDGWAYTFRNLPTSDGRSTLYTYAINEAAVPGYAKSIRGYDITNTYVPTQPIKPKKPSYTPEDWEMLLTLLDERIPLYGGLLKTGDEVPVYPFVFGGLGLIAALLVIISDRRRRSAKNR
jgi:pilin isopeptide linkage protein